MHLSLIIPADAPAVLIASLREAAAVDGRVCIYERYDGSSCEDVAEVSYGDMRPVDDWGKRTKKLDQLWFEVGDATGSDYSGGSVTLANYREFKRMQSAHPDHIRLGFGGHGTYSVYVRLDSPDELWGVVTGLADYPCVDDEAVSEVEREWIEEAMPAAVDDTVQYIVREMCPYVDDLEGVTFDSLHGKLRAVVETASHEFDRWEVEHASAYADPRKIAADVIEYEEFKVWHAEVFDVILRPADVDATTRVVVTTEGGDCVEVFTPVDPDTSHDDIVALVRREYQNPTGLNVEIFTPSIHPLTKD